MQQRREPHDSLDFFPTPLWATRALCEHMARALEGYFNTVYATDVHPYGYGGLADFLFPSPIRADWIVTNPPFRLAEQFIARASEVAAEGVAMLVRIAFLEGVSRYKWLFSRNPPNVIAQFSERVPMFKGRVDATGSSATAYCWLVWRNSTKGTKFLWIPPCRRQLESPGDYV
jgi:hypothetical protein